MIDEAHTAGAIDILKLTCQLYPESSEDVESFGEAYMKSGQKRLAIAAFNRTLKLDPENTNAQENLKALQPR